MPRRHSKHGMPERVQGVRGTQALRLTPLEEVRIVVISNLAECRAGVSSLVRALPPQVGAGNYGAVGVRLRGAQGSGLEDVTVHTGDGLAGVVGGCGSGGAHHGASTPCASSLA